MPEVEIGSSEHEPPLMPKPSRIIVKVFVDDLPAGELEGERPTEFEANELVEEILVSVDRLIRGTGYTN